MKKKFSQKEERLGLVCVAEHFTPFDLFVERIAAPGHLLTQHPIGMTTEVEKSPSFPGENRDDIDHDDDLDGEDCAPVKEWDEGGKSHCGYNDYFHDALMLIGERIHKVVGDPNEQVRSAVKGIGNWFQEASYAARDVRQGKMDVGEETADAIKNIVTGDEGDKRDGGDAADDGVQGS